MTLSPLGQLVGGLERCPQWRSHQQFQYILDSWPSVVGDIVAAQSCPLSIQHHVLMVSTSSAAWAQNLAFQRPQILKKLTSYLPGHSLKDIRFSPAKWTDIRLAQSPTHTQGKRSLKQYHFEQSEARSLWSYHPSHITHRNNASPSVPQESVNDQSPVQVLSRSPTDVFHHWANQIQKRSQHLPKCPRCHCPTPLGELKRWSVCSFCAAKEW